LLFHHFETIRIFLGEALDEKTAAQKPKKVQILATPSQFFFNISQTTKARRLRFLPINLAKNFAQNQSTFKFLKPPATISATSKTHKTVSLSCESLVKIEGNCDQNEKQTSLSFTFFVSLPSEEMLFFNRNCSFN
jgi:hypothetical protein